MLVGLRHEFLLHLAAALGIVGVLLLGPSALAVPAAPIVIEFTQPGGARFSARLRGDEVFSWHETTAGYVITRRADGVWAYAMPAATGVGFVALPNAVVGEADPKGLGLKPGMLPSQTAVAAHLKAIRPSALLPATDTEKPQGAEGPAGLRPPVTAPRPIAAQGTVKNVVILAAFNDHWDSGGGTVASGYGLAANLYSPLFNTVGYTAQGAVGSVRDYYNEVSYGDLTIDSIIVPWVHLPSNMAVYGAPGGGSNDGNPKQMVLDALAAAEAAGFDFSQGDGDGDGWIDCLTIIHSGHDEAYGGNSANNIWSHKWELDAAQVYDGVRMMRYHTEPALRNQEANTTLITNIGVICHELGHFFGLPDLYDYSDQTHGLGSWSIMAGGSWGVGFAPERPVHFDAWSKMMLGWVRPKEIHSGDNQPLAKVETNRDIHVYRDGMTDSEFFLVENRQATGFDADLGNAAGILIYHVDSSATNNALYHVSTYPDGNTHPKVKIEEADGNNSIGSKAAALETNDSWRNTNGLAGGFNDATASGTANAMRYQTGSLYTRSSSDTSAFSYIRMSSFSASAATMTYNSQTLVPGAPSISVAVADLIMNWAGSSDSTKYELQEGVPQTITEFADDCDALNTNWHVGGDVSLASGGSAFAFDLYNVTDAVWLSPVQQLVLKTPFKVTATTTLSYFLQSGVGANSFTFRTQISTDGGTVWKTLATQASNVYPGAQVTISNATITNAAPVGSSALIRFLMNAEQASSIGQLPYYGFLLDTIRIHATEIAGYGSWTTVADTLTSPSTTLSGHAAGQFAFRVRGFTNGVWRNWSDYGTVTVQATGALMVTLAPQAAIDAGAQWSIDAGTTWQNSGATVAGLVPGAYTVTYKAVANWTTPANQGVTVVQDTTATATGTYVAHVGSLTVTTAPQAAITAGAQWSIDGGTVWRASGATVAGLAVGNYTVSFKPVSGWTKPVDQTAAITKDATTTKTGTYVLLDVGTLTVTIAPQGAIDAGAQWSVDGGTIWRNSGSSAANLVVGTYTVSFKTVAGWTKAADQSATITKDTTTTKTGTYVGDVGTLAVTIAPQGAIDAGAQWSIDAGTTWRNSGTTVPNLGLGTYTVTFKSTAGWDTPVDQSATIVKDTTTSKTGTYVLQVGSISVTLAPQGAIDAGAQWSIDAGSTWRASGATVAGLPTGAYTVTFKTTTGWTKPVNQSATVTKNATTAKTGTYTVPVGSIAVTLAPQDAIDAGAQWSIDAGTTWRASGETVADLAVGNHTVTYKAVTDWDTPASVVLAVTDATTSTATGTYVFQGDDPYEVNNTLAKAYDLSAAPGTWLSNLHGLAVQGDADWYKILVPAGFERLQVDCQFLQAEGDIDITVLNESGGSVLLASGVAYSVSGSDNEAVDCVLAAGGTYYILVFGADAANNYDLRWSVVAVDHGSLSVTLTPAQAAIAGGAWSIDQGQSWHSSGETLTGLPVGSYTVSFATIGSWTAPANQPVTITTGTTTSSSAAYIPDSGSLQVTLAPQDAIDAGAQWSVDAGTTWHNSGATVAGLLVGTYSVQFKAVAGWDTPANQSAAIAKNATTTKTGTYVRQLGSLAVTLAPQGAIDAGAQWTIDGGTTWRASATTVANLPTGAYTVVFKPVADWTTPADQIVTVAKAATTTTTGSYVRHIGSLTVTLAPQGAIDAGAQWSIDAGTTWRASATTATGLPTGAYTVSFKAVAGWTTPASQAATITTDATATASATYVQLFGSVSITLAPQAAIDLGAQWSLDAGTTWRDSAATVTGLPVGSYTLTLKAVIGWNAPSASTVTVTANTTTPGTATYLQQLGVLRVQLNPTAVRTLGAQWSIDGGSTWRDHNTTVSNLPVGPYTVTFKSVAGWSSPANQTATVTDATTTTATGLYAAVLTGSASVTILPPIVRDAGARWSVDGGSTWRDSGATVSGLVVGSYTVTFKGVTRWLAPPAVSITVADSATAATTGVYLPIRGDFDGDGLSDLVVQNSIGTTRIVPSPSAGFAGPDAPGLGAAGFSSATDLTLGSLSTWTIRGVADFNNDTRSDLVVQDSTGAVCILEQDVSGNFGGTLKWIYHGALAGWSVRGAADLDGDGDPDLVLQQANGAVALWYIQNETMASSAFLFQNALEGWFVKGSGDFDGDGDADLVLQYSDGRRAFWYLQNGTLASGVFLTAAADPDWQVRDVLATSGTTVKLVEQNTLTRVVRLHSIANNVSTGTTTLDTVPGYGQQVVAAGPLTTGAEPILFMADASTELHFWTIAGAPFAGHGIGHDTTTATPPIASLGVTDTGTATLAALKDQHVFGILYYPGTSSFDYLWQDSAGRIGKTDNDTYSPLGNSWVSTATTTKVAVGAGDMNLDGLADIIFRDADGTISIQYLTGSNSTLAFGSTATIITGLGGWSVAAVGQLGSSASSADLILQHSSGAVVFWEMANNLISSSGFVFNGSLPGWSVRAVTDMGNPSGGAPDGQTDLVLRHSNGTVAVWFLNSSRGIAGSAFVSLDLTGKLIVASGLLQSSTQDDLLLQATDGSGGLTLQPFTNHSPGTPISLDLPALSADGRTMIGTADFNADGNLDLVWTIGSLQIGVSLLDAGGNATNTFWLNSTPYAGWTAVGVTDFDSDGNADIMIRDSSGTVALWRYVGITRSGGYFLTAALADWDPVGTGDLDGDGGTDLLLQNRTTGDLVVWYYKNLLFTGAGSYLLTDLGSLRVKAVGDFDGNRVYDLILRNPGTGAVTLRPLNAAGTPLTLPTGYSPRSL